MSEQGPKKEPETNHWKNYDDISKGEAVQTEASAAQVRIDVKRMDRK